MVREHEPGAEPEQQPAASPAPAAPDAVRALLSRASSPGAVLALQRAAGNVAVGAALQRAAGNAVLARQQTATTPESGYADAVRERRWEAAARALAAMTPESRRTQIDAATTETLLGLAHAAEAGDMPEVRNEVSAKLQEPAHAARAGEIQREEEFNAALTASDWERMVRALERYDDAGMEAKLATFHLEQLNSITDCARRHGETYARVLSHAEPARVRKLGAEWEAAFRGGLWERAVLLVQAYNDIDLPIQLERLSFDQIAALCLQADRMLPAYQRTRSAAEPIRVRKLGEEYEAAVNASNWARATLLVNAYNDLDLLPRLRFIQGKGAPALTAAAAAAAAQGWDDNHRVRRSIAFLVAAPGPRAPNTIPGFAGGTAGTPTAVPGGSVTVTTGDQISGNNDWFGVTYQDTPGGPSTAGRTGWVQFIMIEIESFDSAGRSLGFETAPALPAAVAGFTIVPSSPGAPRWYLDTLGGSAPFYEAPTTGGGASSGGAHQTSPTMTAMYDRPSSDPTVVASIFSRPSVARVVERERFHDYLVRDMDILYRSELYVQFQWTAAPGAGAGDPPRTNVPVSAGAANAMTRGQFNDLVSRFPNYAYFNHT